MRVCVLTNQWPRPGSPHAGVMVVRQVESLPAVGVQPDVVAIDGTLKSYAKAALRVLAMNFQRSRYDLIHAHTGHSGALACLQFRYPVVFSYVGYDLDVPAEDREGPRTKFERLVFRHLSRFVAGTIAKSARGQRRIPAGGLSRNIVLPNGVDREVFSPLPRHEARRRLGWQTEAPTVLFAADPRRFTKRYELARAAVDRARDRFSKLELAICDHVPPEQVPLWMNAADVLLLTSVAEGSPNVVKEALACNLPVVSVDVGDVRELLAGVRHCHVTEADADALADALACVLAARPSRSDGREKSAHLDASVIALRLRAVYGEAVHRRPGLLGFLPRRGQRTRRQEAGRTQGRNGRVGR